MRRYIEIDPAWSTDSPAAPARMAALVQALAADGWTNATGRHGTRFVRHFASRSEYRIAIARVRFTVAAYLAGSQPGE